ncbi:MAG: NifB/NifX family molybdenum-iron cluster-binding protein, partial [Candidatus Aenigmarchaeota archaeon]|nr:NifB/NifX family molybdenum-iron cluster-binding protein [Candidatus Aenigmarchaeota archaeon]
IENSSASQNQGAGISAAQLVVEKDAGALITGNVGPRALDVLKQFKVEIYNGSGTVNETLQKFMDNELEKS